MCASGRFSGKQNNVHELWWNHKILFKSGYARKYNHTFPRKEGKRRLFNLRSWSCHFHTEVLHLYQDLFRLSRLFLDFDHRIYFSAWMDVKKGWICATFVTGNPYGTRVLGKSSQISDWAGTHWSRDIGDLNRTLTCPGQDREVFLPLNCLQGFDLNVLDNFSVWGREAMMWPIPFLWSFVVPLCVVSSPPDGLQPQQQISDPWWGGGLLEDEPICAQEEKTV